MPEQNDEKSGPQAAPVEGSVEQPESEKEKEEKKLSKAEIRIAQIVEAAKVPGASISQLAKDFRVSRETVRKLLDHYQISLETQEEAALPPKGERTGSKIVEVAVDRTSLALTQEWSKAEAEKMLQDINLTGTVVVQEWRPLALSRGQLVHTFLQEAVNDQKVLMDLKQRYAEQAGSFGYGNDLLKYISIVMAFHRNYHDVPLQLERVEEVLESMLAREAHEAKTRELTNLLMSGKKADKARFLLLTQGGQS